MATQEIIIKRHVQKHCSIRQLAREYHMSRKTIRKMLSQGSTVPGYTLTKDRPCPVMGPYKEIILSWLKEDKKAPPKQRHTAERIYQRLVEEYGFSGSSSTVRKTVARMRLTVSGNPRGFVPLAASPGEQAQVDWGEAFVEMEGKRKKVHLFCMRLRSSGTPFVRAYPGEKLEDFLEGHLKAFEYFGGIPRECWYDNLRSAVIKVLSGPYRVEHDLFSSLRTHYLFDSVFCGVRKGNEKGAVENLVGYVRRNALVPVKEYPNLETLNEHLLSWCIRERTKRGEKWEEERQALKPLPEAPFSAFRVTLAKVSSQNLVRYDCNFYSVPEGHRGTRVTLSASPDRIRISLKGELLADHPRCREKGQRILEISHYIPLFEEKKRAVRNAAVVRELQGPWNQARELLDQDPEGYREFASILLLLKEYPLEEVTTALTEALSLRSLQTATVRQVLLNRRGEKEIPRVEAPPALEGYRIPPPELTIYDSLGSFYS